MKGCYALILYLNKAYNIEIGRKFFYLEKGVYVYIGSALGGINGRLNRHLRTFMNIIKNKHWHIDYLLPKSQLLYIIYCYSNERLECILVKKLRNFGFLIINGFGNSDCKSKCGGHLIHMGSEIDKAMDYVKLTFSSLGLKYYLF
ncbi:MAG: GIY-YIG nuclease family protein [Candidatus Methanomethyliaceae archaeon]